MPASIRLLLSLRELNTRSNPIFICLYVPAFELLKVAVVIKPAIKHLKLFEEPNIRFNKIFGFRNLLWLFAGLLTAGLTN